MKLKNYSIFPIRPLISLVNANRSKPATVTVRTICIKSPGISLRASGLNRPAISPARRFPNDVAKNQIPIIWPLYLLGAYFDVAESPTGLKHNSPNVWKRYVINNHLTPAFWKFLLYHCRSVYGLNTDELLWVEDYYRER